MKLESKILKHPQYIYKNSLIQILCLPDALIEVFLPVNLKHFMLLDLSKARFEKICIPGGPWCRSISLGNCRIKNSLFQVSPFF
jgi:hypothetical protein